MSSNTILNVKEIDREILFWLILSSLIAAPTFLDILRLTNEFDKPLIFWVLKEAFPLFTPFLITFFAFLYKLIFDLYPLESIKIILKNIFHLNKKLSRTVDDSQNIRLDIKNIESDEGKDLLLNAESLVQKYSNECDVLAARIFQRSGVYLLVGVVIAFIGLFLFYMDLSVAKFDSDSSLVLIMMLPKIGILFFIEMIAFFFLRQYRSSMDEFRYYESVKRQRENLYISLKLSKEGIISLDDSFFSSLFHSKNGVLKSGEKSEIIESRRLEKNELDLIEKIVDVIAKNNKQ